MKNASRTPARLATTKFGARAHAATESGDRARASTAAAGGAAGARPGGARRSGTEVMLRWRMATLNGTNYTSLFAWATCSPNRAHSS